MIDTIRRFVAFTATFVADVLAGTFAKNESRELIPVRIRVEPKRHLPMHHMRRR